MISCKRGILLLLLVFMSVIWACTATRPRPDLPIIVVTDTAELMKMTREKNPIHETLRAQAHIQVSSRADNYRATEMVYSKKPSFLRLETVGPLGETLLFLTTDLKRVFIYSPTENRYYIGLASKKNLSLLIPLPFKATDIVGLLQGRIDLEGYFPKSMTFDQIKGIYEMTLLPEGSGRGPAVLTVDGRTFSILGMRLYDDDNNLIVSGTFGDFRETANGLFPMTLSYKIPDEGTFITLGVEYSDVEFNTPIDDARFVLDPPRGVQEIDLDKSIINFNRTPIR